MTGQIPQAFIEDLLSRTDIVDIIGSRITLRRAGANQVTCCPFHSEKTPSFTVSSAKQFYHCFGCGASGDAIQFLTEYEGLSFVEAVEDLASRAGLSVPTDKKDKETTARYTAVYQILSAAADFYQQQLRHHPLAPKAHEYLKSRGFTGKIAKEFGLGLASPSWDGLVSHLGKTSSAIESLLAAGLILKKENGGYYDRFRDRILFPIRDRRGRVVGFGGRVFEGGGEPKYLNSPETLVFNKRNELYGLYEARKGNRALTSLLVVEGYLDVVSLSQFGIKNIVATLGTALTEKHVEVLFKQVSELVFCFDGDKAGKEAAKKSLPLILPQIKEGRRVRFMLLPEKEDPDSYVRKVGRPGFIEAIGKAKHLSDFLFESLTEHLDLHHLDSRAQLITTAKPLLNLLPAGILREMLFARLAELANVETAIATGRGTTSKQKTWGSPKKWVKPRTLPPTPAHRAIALLLRERTLISFINNPNLFRDISVVGADLFCAIVEVLRSDPNIESTEIGSKLPPEYFSQFSYEGLSIIADSIPAGGIEQEFIGALERLRESAEERAVELLLAKAKTGVLSEEEKAHLKNLLEQKEKNRVD